ncbi:MAG: hypothetical protein IKC71_04090 [Clostridia bacterium]|nr:hypothetical protein [Clostridia bacterium]
MKKKFLKLSLITGIVGFAFLIIAFFTFHFVTDAGITLIWHPEAGKPYITELFGDFAIINLAVCFVSLLVSFIFFKEKE